MVLSSQQARPGSTRSYMFARRRGPRNQRIAIGAIAFAGLVVVYFILFRGGGGTAEGGAQGDEFSNHGDSALIDGSGLDGDYADAGYRNGSARNATGRTQEAAFAATNVRRPSNDNSGNIRGAERDSTPPSAGNPGPAPAPAKDESGNSNRGGSSGKTSPPPQELEMGRALPKGDPIPVNPNPADARSGGSSSPATGGGPALPASGGANANPSNSDSASGSTEVSRLMAQADQLMSQNRLVDARAIYNVALHHPKAGSVAGAIRGRMGEINDVLMFSPTVDPNDPFTGTYIIQKGDALSAIAPKYAVEWGLLARINNISRPERIHVGQKIKVIRGPFHAVIDKSRYQLDLYIGDPDAQGRRMFVKTFAVGLGELNSTPTGAFVVRQRSKLINPPWTNPRTGEHFDKDDPMNPIGERWIGLEGVDSATQTLAGYGIHGTIDIDSIGRQRSMGCVRLRPDDVNLMYDVLMEGKSSVYIQD